MGILAVGRLVVLGGHVALLLEVLGADLRNVHVNQVGIVSVYFHHLVWVLPIDVDIVVRADVLVRQDHLWFAILVPWRLHVCNLEVTSLLLLIDLKEEVFLGDDLLIGALGEFFALDLVFEFD